MIFTTVLLVICFAVIAALIFYIYWKWRYTPLEDEEVEETNGVRDDFGVRRYSNMQNEEDVEDMHDSTEPNSLFDEYSEKERKKRRVKYNGGRSEWSEEEDEGSSLRSILKNSGTRPKKKKRQKSVTMIKADSVVSNSLMSNSVMSNSVASTVGKSATSGRKRIVKTLGPKSLPGVGSAEKWKKNEVVLKSAEKEEARSNGSGGDDLKTETSSAHEISTRYLQRDRKNIFQRLLALNESAKQQDKIKNPVKKRQHQKILLRRHPSGSRQRDSQEQKSEEVKEPKGKKKTSLVTEPISLLGMMGESLPATSHTQAPALLIAAPAPKPQIRIKSATKKAAESQRRSGGSHGRITIVSSKRNSRSAQIKKERSQWESEEEEEDVEDVENPQLPDLREDKDESRASSTREWVKKTSQRGSKLRKTKHQISEDTQASISMNDAVDDAEVSEQQSIGQIISLLKRQGNSAQAIEALTKLERDKKHGGLKVNSGKLGEEEEARAEVEPLRHSRSKEKHRRNRSPSLSKTRHRS